MTDNYWLELTEYALYQFVCLDCCIRLLFRCCQAPDTTTTRVSAVQFCGAPLFYCLRSMFRSTVGLTFATFRCCQAIRLTAMQFESRRRAGSPDTTTQPSRHFGPCGFHKRLVSTGQWGSARNCLPITFAAPTSLW